VTATSVSQEWVREAGVDVRLRKLEKSVAVQGYLLGTLTVAFLFLTIAVLVLWGERGPPDFDHIAVSLTVFQTLFGIAALYGFWALRGLTRETAQDVAETEVRKIVAALVLREVQDKLQNLPRDTISDPVVDNIARAAGDAGREGEDGK